jgi:hypothetical protein
MQAAMATYLIDLAIDWQGDERFPYQDDQSVPYDIRLRGADGARRISEAKITMHQPPVRKVFVTLARDPVEKLEITRHFANFTRQLDPMQLLDIPEDSAALGEFSIGCWEAAFPTLEKETDLPVSFIRSQFEPFRQRGYAVGGTLKPQAIAGSKAKARIHGKVSGARTELKVEISIKGQVLFERLIWDTPQQAINVAYYPRDIVVEDGHLVVRAAALNLVPEARFPLDSLPQEFQKTLT